MFDGPNCHSLPFGLGTQLQPLWFQMRYLCPVLASPPSGDALVDGAWYRIFVSAQDVAMHKPVTSHFDVYNSEPHRGELSWLTCCALAFALHA